jgi:hypothetical protein
MSRTAEEWGRLAVSLPGWRWMRGMSIPENEHNRAALVDYPPSLVYVSEAGSDERGEIVDDEDWPDPDDPATEGCLIRLLGNARHARQALKAAGHHDEAHRLHVAFMLGKGIGRACIAAAEALGQWPGGAA